jgi:serine/threonine protein kinase
MKVKCRACNAWSSGDVCIHCGASLETQDERSALDRVPTTRRLESFGEVKPLSTQSEEEGLATVSFGAPDLLEESLPQAPDRYRIRKLLGRGGMGEVYQAYDNDLDKVVALKFLRQDLADNAQAVELFKDEIRIARDIGHRHVCRVYDLGQGQGQGRPFFSMELLEGGSLAELLADQGPLPEKLALDIAWQLSSGLAALHEKGLLHRDLKPANVLFDKDRKVRITDLGLAGLVESFRENKSLQGTLPYMSPEQLNRSLGGLTTASDIYSLGLVLYEVFTGQQVFYGHHPADLIAQQQGGFPRPSWFRSDLNPKIEAVILHCLQSKPEDRPRSVDDLYTAIAEIVGGGDRMEMDIISAQPPPKVAVGPIFVTGFTVTGDAFLNRESELSTIFSRLDQGESSAIVGYRKSGKSSLLQRLSEEATWRSYRPERIEYRTLHWSDLHTKPTNFDPDAFWRECLDSLAEAPLPENISQAIRDVGDRPYENRGLKKIFDLLKRQGHQLILLLDEFEQLFFHPNFDSRSRFFAHLRSLVVTSPGSLSLVIATRRTIGELNHLGPSEEDGSPYFNYFVDVSLPPFSDRTIEQLLDRGAAAFSSEDRLFIRCLAGRQPYLLQGAAATLLESAGDKRRTQAAENFYRRVSSHFDHLWAREEPRRRTVLMILGIAEWAGRAVGESLDGHRLVSGDDLGYELGKLETIGFAERLQEDHPAEHRFGMKWQGERWTLGIEVFLWWVWEVVFIRHREMASFAAWQQQETYHTFLKEGSWEFLVTAAQKNENRGVTSMIETFDAELASGATDG